MVPVKYWEIIADNLSKAGFSLGLVSALDMEGRTIWIVDAHGYGNRFIVRADETLTAFGELQRARHEFAVRCGIRYFGTWVSGNGWGPQLCSYSFVQRFS